MYIDGTSAVSDYRADDLEPRLPLRRHAVLNPVPAFVEHFLDIAAFPLLAAHLVCRGRRQVHGAPRGSARLLACVHSTQGRAAEEGGTIGFGAPDILANDGPRPKALTEGEHPCPSAPTRPTPAPAPAIARPPVSCRSFRPARSRGGRPLRPAALGHVVAELRPGRGGRGVPGRERAPTNDVRSAGPSRAAERRAIRPAPAAAAQARRGSGIAYVTVLYGKWPRRPRARSLRGWHAGDRARPEALGCPQTRQKILCGGLTLLRLEPRS